MSGSSVMLGKLGTAASASPPSTIATGYGQPSQRATVASATTATSSPRMVSISDMRWPVDHTLQPGDAAPNVVLDAITRQGKVAVDDFRGRTPVLIGIFRGLHCPYCRRHIAAMAQLEPALRDAKPEERFQFERHGYFVADRVDSRPGVPRFNRAVTLRDSWSK